MKRTEQNLAMSRDEKIAKVIREGHEIAEKLKNIQSVEELDNMEAEINLFKQQVNAEFGQVRTYEPYFDGKDKFSQLSFELSMVVEEKERQLIYYPDQAETAKKSIEQEFEEYLDHGDWHIEKDAE